MFLHPTEFKFGAVGTDFATSGTALALAKEGINLKIEDTEIEILGAESESPIDRVITGSKFEVKGVFINPEYQGFDLYTGMNSAQE